MPRSRAADCVFLGEMTNPDGNRVHKGWKTALKPFRPPLAGFDAPQATGSILPRLRSTLSKCVPVGMDQASRPEIRPHDDRARWPAPDVSGRAPDRFSQ